MILKKKEIVAASLVLLIGIAGYLNWSYQDTIHITDGESYIETGKKLGEAQYVSGKATNVEEDTAKTEAAAETKESEPVKETAGAKEAEEAPPAKETDNNGEADQKENVAASEEQKSEVITDGSGSFFEQARIDREAARSKSVEILNQTAANESFDSEIRKKAGEKLLAVSSDIENENTLESVAMSKGYAEICAYINDGGARIMVRQPNFSEADVVKITDIATEILNLSANCVKIVEVK